MSRFLLERKLISWGFEVITTEDGEAACALLEGPEPPSIAVLDWEMPRLNGLEACRRLRSRPNAPYVYLVLLSARNQKDEIAEGLEAGFDDYVMKPFDPDELRARLRVGQRVVALERALAKQTGELERALAENQKLKALLPR